MSKDRKEQKMTAEQELHLCNLTSGGMSLRLAKATIGLEMAKKLPKSEKSNVAIKKAQAARSKALDEDKKQCEDDAAQEKKDKQAALTQAIKDLD